METEVQTPTHLLPLQMPPSALLSTLEGKRETGTWESGLGVPSPKLEEQSVETLPEAAPLRHFAA